MPITHGNNGERVHYDIRLRPWPAGAIAELAGLEPAKFARDIAAVGSKLPSGLDIAQRMVRCDNDIFFRADISLTGAINPLNRLMGYGRPAWFDVPSITPPPPSLSTSRLSSMHPVSKIAFVIAYVIASFCNDFMRWLTS